MCLCEFSMHESAIFGYFPFMNFWMLPFLPTLLGWTWFIPILCDTYTTRLHNAQRIEWHRPDNKSLGLLSSSPSLLSDFSTFVQPWPFVSTLHPHFKCRMLMVVTVRISFFSILLPLNWILCSYIMLSETVNASLSNPSTWKDRNILCILEMRMHIWEPLYNITACMRAAFILLRLCSE